ncbi:MAG: MFS transporter [Deltaproteobacteria bacterium]|nr:MFS transporter [Deltaproteobacteria bacterium]
MNAPYAPRTHRRLTTAAILLVMAMSALEATVVSTAMPTVIAELGGVAYYGWVAASYLLAVTVSVTVYGKLADSYGRRPVFLAGIAMFLLGSLACGASGSIPVLIAARLLQGLGAGAIQPTTMTLIGDLYTLEERGRVQGLFGAVWGVSGIVGPLVGGWLLRGLSWRWVFWVNIPFGVLGALVFLYGYREARPARAPAALDLQGAASLGLSAGCLLLGCGGHRPAVTLTVSALAAVLFVLVERRAEDPMVPLGLLRERTVAVTTASTMLLGGAMMGALTFMPLYAQGVLRATPTQAGATVAAMLVGWPIASAVTARLLVKVGFRRPMLLGSWVVAAALLGIAATLSPAVPRWSLQAWMVLYGLGMGVANTASLLVVQTSVDASRRGVVTGVNAFGRSIGSAVGTGALGALLTWRLLGLLPFETVQALLRPDRRGEPLPGDPAALAEALSRALLPLFWVLAGVGLLNVLVAHAMPEDSPRRGGAPR